MRGPVGDFRYPLVDEFENYREEELRLDDKIRTFCRKRKAV